MNIYDHIHALANALKNSDELKGFKEAKEKLEADKEAKEMFLDFRKYQFELQKDQLEGKQIEKERGERLRAMYEAVSLNNTVREYLIAETRIGKIMSDVSKILGEAVGLDELEEMNGSS